MSDLLGDPPWRPDLLLEYLHRIQDALGHIPAELLHALADALGLPPAAVWETADFYHHFDPVRPVEEPPAPLTIRVCDSIPCQLAGAEPLCRALQQSLGDKVRIQRVSCVGRCAEAPVAVVGRNPLSRATPERVAVAVADGATEPALPAAEDLAGYRSRGGYRLLQEIAGGRGPDREQLLQRLEQSGLRGLGGAGFPAARKWRILLDQPAPRLLVVNIDEGEPGTFKDRHFLERQPHRLFEGMLIAARVVACSEIYIYLRDEYAGLRALLTRELERLQADPPCPLPPIHLRRGAGAYICGEESALIESIEGRPGLPRLRPPYVAERGLFGRPTLEHNMETLFHLPELLQAPPGGAPRLRAYSVSGRVRRPGVYQAPAGISVRRLIDDYCGGMAPGHELYAYLPGGASGGILPARLDHLPLDFGTLEAHGCFIGSAAVIVLSQHDSVRQTALDCMRFFRRESCGQCTPCRAGTAHAVALMERSDWDLPLLRELAEVMAEGSICGLGQAAPNPLLSLIRHFPRELEDG